MKKIITLLFVFIMSLSLAYADNDNDKSNIALGKTVAVNSGKFFVGGWGGGLISDYSTITDGMIFELWHQWDQGPIWWQENIDNIQNTLTVFLGPKSCKVTKLSLQVDNNDDYIVSWVDSHTHIADHANIIPARNWGMSNVSVNINAYTNAFVIRHDEHGAGDNLYAISEFQAFGKCD